MTDQESLQTSYAEGRADELNLLADLGLLIPITEEAHQARYIRLAADQVRGRFGDDAAGEVEAQWPYLMAAFPDDAA